jgi:hypothetical protein
MRELPAAVMGAVMGASLVQFNRQLFITVGSGHFLLLFFEPGNSTAC